MPQLFLRNRLFSGNETLNPSNCLPSNSPINSSFCYVVVSTNNISHHWSTILLNYRRISAVLHIHFHSDSSFGGKSHNLKQYFTSSHNVPKIFSKIWKKSFQSSILRMQNLMSKAFCRIWKKESVWEKVLEKMSKKKKCPSPLNM